MNLFFILVHESKIEYWFCVMSVRSSVCLSFCPFVPSPVRLSIGPSIPSSVRPYISPTVPWFVRACCVLLSFRLFAFASFCLSVRLSLTWQVGAIAPEWTTKLLDSSSKSLRNDLTPFRSWTGITQSVPHSCNTLACLVIELLDILRS